MLPFLSVCLLQSLHLVGVLDYEIQALLSKMTQCHMTGHMLDHMT